MTGYGHIQAQLSGPNTLKGYRLGFNRIEFHDEVGGVVEWNNACMKINGVVMNERVITFMDEINLTMKYVKGGREIQGVVRFHDITEKGGIFGKFKSYVKEMWTYSDVPKDFCDIVISEGKEEVKGVGSWLEYIEIDGERL